MASENKPASERGCQCKSVKVGVIGAMELEVETLKSKMQVESKVTKAGMEFFSGKLNGVDVIIVRSGVGKVNAAVCTQILIDAFAATHIVNTGVAGSLNADINIGDIVISDDVCYHDVDATGFGYALGQVPSLKVFSFPADRRMAALAQEVCKKVNPDINVFFGRIVSGDQFICDKAVKDRITENFKGLCTEMEGTAIGQTAYLNDVPFVILRAISDKADNSAEMDYPAFERKAAEHCARLLEEFIREL